VGPDANKKMNEQELERAIDAAAGDLVRHEPGRALAYEVMARVREHVQPAPRRFVWAATAAGVLFCATLSFVLLYRIPLGIPTLPSARPFAVAQIPTLAPPIAADDLLSAHRVSPASITQRAAPPARPLPIDVSPIDPIQTEPIAVSELDVPQLARETTSIPDITIEVLTIEPLAASND
jgi:hypothetical protein